MSDSQKKKPSPFSEGFRAGMMCADELTETQTYFESLAEFYRCETRTIRRWHEAGVDLSSPISVARYVLEQRNSSQGVLERIAEIFD